ncbi:response regulator transcription factor [Caulobacter segnis]|uniref:Two component transcriptional regulator, LuxR family n=1 Tax=Caulobacter segnis (strain ATCC 21756 / DSM 7131 / JCM 7823 / NBRC 15250 / LMG 17158 / TK0059) TaxID=509190 RepID=D5VGU8_CAUST|nr:response regulator transcription factor [Caulobacter segnis]ADG10541.1 two component transcriptional regulator, LuxR family [Caulobacter segnis ATCC 21756]
MVAQTVHIVDDDAALREALDSLFRSVGLETRLFANAQAFLESGAAQEAGCLVLDVRLPGLSGLDFQEKLAAADVRMPIVLMTGHGDIPMSVRGMKAGAVDFLTKPFRDQDMLDAVASALQRDAASRAQQGDISDLRARFEGLSAREKQVMARVASGLMNKQVAHQLGLSEITVKIHRGNLMRKMEAKSLADLVRMAEALKLRPDDPS